jgi:hypothetical protein
MQQNIAGMRNWRSNLFLIGVLENEDFLNNPTITCLSCAVTTSHPIE